jgi:hypothetical protein
MRETDMPRPGRGSGHQMEDEDELDKMVEDILKGSNAKQATVAPSSNGDYLVG